MRKNLRPILTLLITLSLSFPILAQNNFFTRTSDSQIPANAVRKVVSADRYMASSLNVASLRNFLWSLPVEQNAIRAQAPILTLPMPDGSNARFSVWESSIMEPGLAAKYPDIKTFAGQGIDDPYATIRFDFNPYFGFSAQILSPSGDVYIDPYLKGSSGYSISYYAKDNRRSDARLTCLPPEIQTSIDRAREQAGPCRGTQLFTYRLALACTGEYAVRVCLPASPTVPLTLAAMTTSANRVNGIYESELAVRLILINNTDQLIFLDGATDTYTNNNGSTMLGQNQRTIDSIIGIPNYDIGHVFSTGGGGIASVGSVCNNSFKARGVTGLPNPVGDNFDVDFVAHEMGHQFGANHTFNSTTSQCGGGNRNSSTAYEVGGGTTIMGYAGICGSNDIQPHSDPFFHSISFDEISSFLQSGGTCRNIISTGNTLPQITAMNNNGVSIPLNTPFTLSASATDADGDAITYSWEQWDIGAAGNWNSGASTTDAPLFKSRVPKTTGSRTFPDMAVILAGYPANPAATMGGLKGETLPTVARAMKFRLTVRDNRAGGGGVVTGGEGCQAGFASTFQVNAVAATGPFLVTSPNGGESFPGGSVQTITWDVAGTNAAPINCASVRILLSTDGGLTYPTVLANSTTNDGSASVSFPAITSTTARIKIEAVGNIFFDISNANFTLTTPLDGFDFDNPPTALVACAGPASVDITLGTISIEGFSTPVNLSVNSPDGTTVGFSSNPVIPGNSTVITFNGVNTLSNGLYIMTVTGTAGSITRTRDISIHVLNGTGPVISVQPQATQACENTDAVFSVTASGVLGYQWQVSTNGGASFSNITGANSSSYTEPDVTTALNNNQYRVVLTGQCNTTNSNAAILTVLTAPAISAHPQNTTLCINSNALFSVTATGANISYQWQLSTDGGSSFNPIGGALSGTYVENSITSGMNGRQYRVIITGTCAPPATSNPAILTVISPVTVSDNPQDVTVCETSNDAVFTVAGNSTVPVIYQWQVSTDGGSNFTNLSNGAGVGGATTAQLILSNITVAQHNNQYRALLSNATCTTPATSSAAVLTVNPRPSITLNVAPSATILPGQSATLTGTITPATPGFNITWLKNDVIIPGVTGASYLVDSVEVGDYKMRINNPVTGCTNESAALTIGTSASERLFVFPNPADGQFTVSYFNSAGTPTQQVIAVYDARGAQVYSARLTVAGSYTLHNINIRGVASGVYFVVIGNAAGKRMAEEKIIIR